MATPSEATTPARAATSAQDSVRALFRARDLPVYDERMLTLAEGDPADWEGLAFPVEFAVELAAVCNLDCVMCPVPTTRRPKQLMSAEVFRAVMDQAAAERGFVLLPQGFGESMLNKQWAEMLAYARQRGISPIVMLTNGTLLDERNVERLLDLEIDAVVVSIDGVTQETYGAVRVGGDLARVEANVRRLLARRGDRAKPTVCLRIIRMKDTAAEIDAFFDRWRPLLRDADELRINEYNDWSGKVGDRSVAGPAAVAARGPCRMLWRNLSVHADGQVSACCHDSEDELIVGDLAAGETVQEIWRGAKLERLRRLHREGRIDELPICARCKAWY